MQFHQSSNRPTLRVLTCAVITAVSSSGIDRASAGPNGEIPETGLPGDVKVTDLPTPKDAKLLKGREVWSGTCQGCHGFGVAGSPKITNKKAWAPRIAKGMDVLVKHAIEGFFGEDDTEMPARGGNDKLTDDEVAAAVAYMVAMSK